MSYWGSLEKDLVLVQGQDLYILLSVIFLKKCNADNHLFINTSWVQHLIQYK